MTPTKGGQQSVVSMIGAHLRSSERHGDKGGVNEKRVGSIDKVDSGRWSN